MGYRALLFCPDEKTAQTVTLILNDLEFSVEACAEPFAAVKKLVGEHFDGVVVDCDNEQNATLLFKSARQSTTNQAALAVAIVEGQAGVAKAFRIGANLVLTKPINVEQSKGTLRVARGLLRKGENAKPLAHAENTPTAAPAASAPSRPTKPSTPVPQRATAPPTAAQRPSAPVIPAPWGNRIADPVAPVAQASAQDSAESEIDSGKTIDETVLDLAGSELESESRTASASASTSAAAKGSTPQASRTPSSAAASSVSSAAASAASAVAPARIPHEAVTNAKGPEPLLSKIARTVNPITDLLKTGEAQAPVVAAAKANSSISLEFEDSQINDEAVSSSKIEQKTEAKSQPQTETSASRKILLAAVAIVLLGVAVYLGWSQLHGKLNSGSMIGSVIAPSSAAKPVPPARALQPANASVRPSSTAPVPSTASPQDLQTTTQTASNRDQNDSASDSANDASASAPLHKVSAGSGAAKSGAQPLVVRSGKAKAAKHAAADTAAPNVVVSADNTSGALPNLIDVSTKSTPVLQTLAVSQGVSQGLIVKRIQPTYPDAAFRLHLEGSVQLMATVGKNGSITAVKTLSGEPLLAQAATVAVKQWKYKPYLLDGQPVEIQTQVTINFKLPH
jgi:TonB family protein